MANRLLRDILVELYAVELVFRDKQLLLQVRHLLLECLRLLCGGLDRTPRCRQFLLHGVQGVLRLFHSILLLLPLQTRFLQLLSSKRHSDVQSE